MPERGAVELYGITNCDQVKRARGWLKEQGIAYTFHDFKAEEPSAELVRSWLKTVPWDTLINRRGTTWRQLAEKDRPVDVSSALNAALAKPSLIKRPVLVFRGAVTVGFEEAHYQALFG
jgi:arsenate reductase